MRPIRLEIEGFTAFRDPVVVDFEGVDLFALTGPTGSGKSSVIDAAVFALYGCVPRYDDRRLVAPAITQGLNEARVKLDFSVGADRYAAVRVVRRTKTGATTKEARLEGADGTVLAGNEKEVGAAVEALLGLSFEHFTTCVVLPQGEFARFLHDKPERRQGLLVSLLDLGLYDRMARSARTREAAAKARVDAAEARLADLAFADDDARRAAAARVVALDSLLRDVERDVAKLDELVLASGAARATVTEATTRATALESIRVPDGVAELAAVIVSAEAAAASARSDEQAFEAATVQAETALQRMPARPRLEAARAADEQAAAHTASREKGRAVLVERYNEETRAAATLAAAEQRAADAAAELDRAQWEHRAHDLAASLKPGEPCPVCEQVVAHLPSRPAPAEVSAAREAAREAGERVTRLRHELDAITDERVRVEEKLALIESQLAGLGLVLVDFPDAEAVASELAGIAAVEAEVEQARGLERGMRAARVRADSAVAAARKLEVQARRTFDSIRDEVALWGAPARQGDDLAAMWGELAAWAEAEAPLARRRAAAAEEQAAELEAAQRELIAAIEETGRAHGVRLVMSGGGSLRDVVVDARTIAQAALARIDDALAEAGTRRAEVKSRTAEAQVAGALARHLSATGFEKWVLDEALELLVAGATEILLGLSDGQYSLTLDPRTSNFMVVDHRNADERRSARTLSGGETFLASLALALALADQLTLLAARGGARLESIFLDEGFGTLDADTLDVVASAIEELGATGRMVGLVSHVADLAARVPVRFEVTKAGLSSTVTRVEA